MSRDLEGRRFIVTGGNTGIGRATVHALAERGAAVTVASRSAERTMPVIEEIRRATDNDAVDMLELDLASLASVRAAAEQVLERDAPLHCLINNAGLAGHRGLTAEGFELTFGVNHLGHFLLTLLLLDRLKASAPARIVNVASQAHYRISAIDWERVRRPAASVTGFTEYKTSKLCNVLFTKELARRHEGTGVTAYALHPGVIASDIWRRVPWPIRPLLTAFMSSNEEGAQTTIHCATAPELATETGLYYDACRAKAPNPLVEDPGLARELWERSERWAGLA